MYVRDKNDDNWRRRRNTHFLTLRGSNNKQQWRKLGQFGFKDTKDLCPGAAEVDAINLQLNTAKNAQT